MPIVPVGEHSRLPGVAGYPTDGERRVSGVPVWPPVLLLGAVVVAEHPEGHRLVGEVRGAGTRGVALACAGIPGSPFLSYEDGWTVEVLR